MYTGISREIDCLELAYEKEEMCKELKEMEIELDGPDVADVILLAMEKGSWYYVNLMTGKKGKNYKEVMREDRKFTIVRWPFESLIDLKYPTGCYFKYIEKYDLVMVVFCALKLEDDNYKWVEINDKHTNRLFISKDYHFEDNNWSYEDITTAKDICGQASIDYDSLENTTEQFEKGYFVNVPTGIQKVLTDYFTGCVSLINHEWKEKNTDDFSFQTLQEIHTFVTSFMKHNFESDSVSLESGIHLLHGRNTLAPFILPDIPDKAMQRMQGIMNIIMFSMTSNCYTKTVGLKSISFSCLQNIGGTIYLRSFLPIMSLHSTREKTEVYMIEFERIVINEDMYTNSHVSPALLNCGIPVWCDDNLKGTPFEYTAEPLRDYIKNLDCIIENNYMNYFTYYHFMSLSYHSENCVIANSLVKIAYELGISKPFERIFKSIKNREQKRIVANKVANTSAKRFLRYFAPIDEKQKSMTKMLGISSELLELFLTGRIDWDDIHLIKNIFQTKEASEYLLSMNKEDSHTLLECVHELSRTYDDGSIWRDNPIELLVDIYGYRNWKNYFNFVTKKLAESERDIYFNYLTLVKGLNLESQPAEWKLTGDALLKSLSSVLVADYALNGEKNEYFIEQFKQMENYWKKKEYKDDKFLVTYPKNPADLITEGLYLKHCAKEFVEAVAYGDTDIYFIRKIEEPDVPFYTMEVRNGAIRQCHGFSNRNISKDIAAFLNKFAEKNNIHFKENETGLLLGPDADGPF